MNVLIKGTTSAVKNALSKIDADYELINLTYDPDKAQVDDTVIVKAGVIFEAWDEGYIEPDEIPFASIPEIKFIGLGNGGDGFRTDGSYVFYKDFGETSVSECYQFSRISPLREEFDAQYDVFENVYKSFMDHTWQYRFEDYSCGEYCSWAFNGKKDKALIEKWKSDEKDDSKKSEKEIVLGGMDGIPFKYENIDGISPSFYSGINDGNDFIVSPDETISVSVNGTDFVLALKTEKKMGTVLKKYKKALIGKELGRAVFNPLDVVSGKYSPAGFDEYGQEIYNVSDDAEELMPVQIAHRASIFAKINELIRDEKAAAQIVEACPKKKNGTFALKRVTQIASLFCMEDDASMYVLCAVAKKDTELQIEVRQIASVDMEKTYSDVISVSNLFRA